jgi:hypothetical protein
MDLQDDLVFRPLPPVKETIHFPFHNPPFQFNPLGPLAALAGSWGGKGFNTIWRPFFPKSESDRFLELNLTNDAITFDVISGPIPNRGLLQPDINMFGLTYLQQVSDANLVAALHIEPGIWAVVPLTVDPAEAPTVVRMASIPHGTTILSQGTASFASGPPIIPDNDIFAFAIGDGPGEAPFREQDLSVPTPFRSSGPQMVGITQDMVSNPNSVLQQAIAGQDIISTTTLQVSTRPAKPVTGGGTANTAFLAGGANGPNAVAAEMSATFWIEVVKGTPDFLQLQYSQRVLLNFNGLSWPHVTVGTLTKNVPVEPAILRVDPDIPIDLLKKVTPPVPPGVGAPVRAPLPGYRKETGEIL